MTHPTLFDEHDDPPAIDPRTMARATDAHTSHAAAEEVTASGAADAQRARVLAALRARDGQTSDEIAQAAGMQRHAAARRCPELERLGLIRRGEARASRITGRQCVVWWVVEPAQEVA